MTARALCRYTLGASLLFALAVVVQTASQKSALVTVVAEAAGPVKGLAAADFVVTEDKDKREVVGVEPATDPLFISVLVDTSQPPLGVQPPTRDLRAAVSTFVKMIQAASPDSEISLTEFAGAAVTTVDFTKSGEALDKVIQKLFPNQQSSAVLIEAIADAGRKVAVKPAPRRAIVSIDFRSQEGSGDQSMKKAAEEVKKSGATVWAISIGNANSAPGRESVLNTVTQSSGGMRLTAFEPSALEGLLKQVANTLLSQYTVTFARPGDGPAKNVKMETTRGAKVLVTPWMR
jgi:von Willebrand factor type A domain